MVPAATTCYIGGYVSISIFLNHDRTNSTMYEYNNIVYCNCFRGSV